MPYVPALLRMQLTLPSQGDSLSFQILSIGI